MPTTKKLAELFRALAADDVTGATGVAAQICNDEEGKGHFGVARHLRGALAGSGNGAKCGHDQNAPGQNGNGLINTALVALPSDVNLVDVVLTSSARRELKGVIAEWKHRDSLQRRGLAPRSKLLFHGPPGCGKSLTARALGHELGLPVWVVRFDAVIGSYLGQTAIHLRQLFHLAETTSCVLLLDELDALGKRRGNPLDVGELDRIVISLMQELEHSRPRGLIIGTSNMPRHLDDALWRRFDLALAFGCPKRTVLTTFAKKLAASNKVSLPTTVLRRAAGSRSFADAESVVMAEARRQALEKHLRD